MEAGNPGPALERDAQQPARAAAFFVPERYRATCFSYHCARFAVHIVS